MSSSTIYLLFSNFERIGSKLHESNIVNSKDNENITTAEKRKNMYQWWRLPSPAAFTRWPPHSHRPVKLKHKRSLYICPCHFQVGHELMIQKSKKTEQYNNALVSPLPLPLYPIHLSLSFQLFLFTHSHVHNNCPLYPSSPSQAKQPLLPLVSSIITNSSY